MGEFDGGAEVETLDAAHAAKNGGQGALAESARTRLDAADPVARPRILDLLGISVRVAGWTRCGTCGGTGKVAVDPPDPVTGKRQRGAQG